MVTVQRKETSYCLVRSAGKDSGGGGGHLKWLGCLSVTENEKKSRWHLSVACPELWASALSLGASLVSNQLN